mgnify:CR=1 FL=1
MDGFIHNRESPLIRAHHHDLLEARIERGNGLVRGDSCHTYRAGGPMVLITATRGLIQ